AGADPAAFGGQPQKDAPRKPAKASKQQKAGTTGEPGEAHKNLELLVGDWESEVKIWFAQGKPPMSFKESVTREPLFDKRFVMERVEATSDMGPYHGLSIVGYNNAEKRYEMFFIDNGGTAMNMWTGTFDAAKKEFTFTGTEMA